MDPKFRSSFIPKKPLPIKSGGGKIRQHRSFNLAVFLSGLLFIAALGLTGGAYLFEKIVDSRVNQKGIELNSEKNNLGLERVEDYRALANRLKAAQTLMSNHKAFSNLFFILNEQTLHNVAYSGFTIDDRKKDENAQITITGQAASFNALTVQTDVFKRGGVINNIKLDEISLDENGNVSFQMSAEAVGSRLLYTNDI